MHTHSTKAVVLWPEIIDVMHAGLNWIVIAQVLWNHGDTNAAKNEPSRRGFGS